MAKITLRDFQTIGDALPFKDPLKELTCFIWQSIELKTFTIDDVSKPAKRVLFVDRLIGEVLFNGFDGFFCNSAGRNSTETLQALTEINAVRTYKLLAKLLESFPEGKASKDRMERYEQLTSLGKPFNTLCNECDHVFYENVETHPGTSTKPENLWALCVEEMERNKTQSILIT